MGRFTDLYGTAFKKYADFSGRACRAEICAFQITNTLIFFLLYIPIVILFIAAAAAENTGLIILAGLLGLILFVFSVAILVPSISLNARRLHDLNQSGWWQVGIFVLQFVLSFIPIIGICTPLIPIVIYYCLPGTEGENNYGPVSEKY